MRTETAYRRVDLEWVVREIKTFTVCYLFVGIAEVFSEMNQVRYLSRRKVAKLLSDSEHLC